MSKKSGVKKGAGGSGFLERLNLNKQIWTVKVIHYAMQYAMDAACIALHEEYGFGAERLLKFQRRYLDIYQEMRDLEKKDDDEQLVAHAKIEQALKAALGKYYQPREVRFYCDVEMNGKTLYSGAEEVYQ